MRLGPLGYQPDPRVSYVSSCVNVFVTSFDKQTTAPEITVQCEPGAVPGSQRDVIKAGRSPAGQPPAAPQTPHPPTFPRCGGFYIYIYPLSLTFCVKFAGAFFPAFF